MSHPSAERLSAYIDGELDAAERAALEQHLAGCAECQGAALELRGVRRRLGSDGIRSSDAPSQAEWRAIEQRIHRRGRLRSIGIGAGLLAAAALAVFMIARPTPAVDGPSAVYSQATGDLEALLHGNRTRLRPETVRAIERSIAVIDSALTQAEQALAADPANDYVIRSIDQLRGRRLATLRDAVALAQE